MEEFFRRNLASLKGSEAKLLLSMLLVPQASKSELMQLSGINNRVTLWRAQTRLEELGLVTWAQHARPFCYTEATSVTPMQQSVTPRQQEDVTPEQHVAPTQQDDLSMDFETALALADDMDASGDERRPDSPFLQRRKQQLTLLRDAWADLFGETIPMIAIKQLLQTARSQALDVYYAMQQAADRKVQYPKAYVRKVLEELAKKPKAAAASPTVDQEGLMPVTDAMRQSWAENEKLVAGYMSGWEV